MSDRRGHALHSPCVILSGTCFASAKRAAVEGPHQHSATYISGFSETLRACNVNQKAPKTHKDSVQDDNSPSARNSAAVFSRLSASARTADFTPASSKAARKTFGAYCALRLLTSVFLFCPKASLRKAMNSASGTSRLSSFDTIRSRTTLDSTLGGGENAPGGSVNNFSTSE